MEVLTSMIGFIDMDKVVNSTAAYKQGEKDLEAHKIMLETQLQQMMNEYEALSNEYQQNTEIWTDLVKASKIQEIANLEERIREAQANVQASVEEKRATIVKAIEEKIRTVTEQLAKEKELDFVFTASEGSSLVYAKENRDLTAEVIQRLN